jgi:anti-sigma-K factor RskA
MNLLSGQIRSVQEEANRSKEFVTLLSMPGAKLSQLQSGDQSSFANAQLVYDRRGRAMLMANGLAPVPEGKAYQLWFIVGKNPPIPGKTFAPDAAGRGDLTDQVPEAAMDSAVFAITLEPEGGSRAPTGAIYLRSTL